MTGTGPQARPPTLAHSDGDRVLQFIKDFIDNPPASGGPWITWGSGVALPIAIIAYNAIAASIRHFPMMHESGGGTLPGSQHSAITRDGRSALEIGVWLGIYIGIAALIHAHYFWGNVPRLAQQSPFAKIAAMAIIPVSLLIGLIGSNLF